MEPEANEQGESALRPLRNVAGVVASLAGEPRSDQEQRSAVVQVASAVEQSLRRLLRDHPNIAMPIRLRALAPDELRADEALAELRQHDRISIDLAAAVHDLLEARRRLKSGGPLEAGDPVLAQRVAERLHREIVQPHPGASTLAAPPPPAAPEDATVAYPTPPGPGARRRTVVLGSAVAVLLLLLVALGLWWARAGNDAQMERAIALFRSGAYADAASHFYRYAQEHPDDPTPRLYLARIHRRMNRPDLAVPELRAAMELAPEDPAVQTELGFLLTDRGEYDAAVQRFRRALEQDDQSAAAWGGLVRALRASGRPDAAERVLAQAPEQVRELIAGGAAAGSAPF